MTDYLRHKDLYGLVILFEDLVADLEAECKRFFDYIGISYKHIPKALGALKEDSQRGTFGKWRKKKPEIPYNQYDYLDLYLKSFDLDPRISCHMSTETLRKIVC
jgi:hypothetical protein